MIQLYFINVKLKYFEDGSYNYNKFPKDIRSNSVLERYNKDLKNLLGEKLTCNWLFFLNFINNELNRINNLLSKNENKNILYESKYTKFWKNKFNAEYLNKEKQLSINTEIHSEFTFIRRGNKVEYSFFLLVYTSYEWKKVKKNIFSLQNKSNDR